MEFVVIRIRPEDIGCILRITWQYSLFFVERCDVANRNSTYFITYLRANELVSYILDPGGAMRVFFSVSIVLAFLLASNAPAFEGNESTGDCGTLLSFHHDYEAAFELAAKENKPLFVVHLSGNLRNEDYT